MTEIESQPASVKDLPVTIERSLGHRIHIFSNTIQGSFYKRTEQPFGITLPEWRVLRSIVFDPGRSQAEVAASEALNVMNVSRAVAGLRRKGLLNVAPDPDDGRRTLLTPTGLAAELSFDMIERERVVYEHLFSVLSPEERKQLDGLLGRVNDLIRSADLPPPPPPSRDWAAEFGED